MLVCVYVSFVHVFVCIYLRLFVWVCIYITSMHLADAFIQSDLQKRALQKCMGH